jgi:hypothetical protein
MLPVRRNRRDNGLAQNMSKIYPECADSGSSDRSLLANLILRQEPDEEEDEEEDDEGNSKKDENGEREDDGYSE